MGDSRQASQRGADGQVGWPGGLGRVLVSTRIHVTDFVVGLSSRLAPQSLLCEAENSVRDGCVMYVSRGTPAALLLLVPRICWVGPCLAHCLGAADSRSIMSGNESLTRYPGVVGCSPAILVEAARDTLLPLSQGMGVTGHRR